jgi:hypothetical protein
MAEHDLHAVAFPTLQDSQIAALGRCVPRTEWLPPEIERDAKEFVRAQGA